MNDIILVGVDGSAPSLAALKWAVTEAKRRAMSVRAVTVHMPQGHLVIKSGSEPLVIVSTRSMHTEYAERLAGIVGSIDTDVPIEQVVVAGQIEDVLTEMSHHAAMLILGRHGDSHMLLGRSIGLVSSHCVRAAACPVIVVSP